MTALTPAQISAKWSQNLASAADTATAGVNALTVSPGALAARQSGVWAANVASAKAKYQRNVGAVTLDEWRSAYLTKGIPRMSAGATAAQPKMEAFMGSLLTYQKTALASLPPRGTYEQNKARATAWIDKMHAFQYKGGNA
ncbi:MAG: hypothetical protein ACREHG_02665 [Candidatus Saccharimonadales bacterium]